MPTLPVASPDASRAKNQAEAVEALKCTTASTLSLFAWHLHETRTGSPAKSVSAYNFVIQ